MPCTVLRNAGGALYVDLNLAPDAAVNASMAAVVVNVSQSAFTGNIANVAQWPVGEHPCATLGSVSRLRVAAW